MRDALVIFPFQMLQNGCLKKENHLAFPPFLPYCLLTSVEAQTQKHISCTFHTPDFIVFVATL